MKHLRKGGFLDVETVGPRTNAHIPIQPGRSPLPADIRGAALTARRIPILKATSQLPVTLFDSFDVEWRG